MYEASKLVERAQQHPDVCTRLVLSTTALTTCQNADSLAVLRLSIDEAFAGRIKAIQDNAGRIQQQALNTIQATVTSTDNA